MRSFATALLLPLYLESLQPLSALAQAHHPSYALVLAASAAPPLIAPGDQRILRPEKNSKELDLKLRHVFHHGTYRYPNLHRRLDVPDDAKAYVLGEDDGLEPRPATLRAKSKPMPIQRLRDRSQKRMDDLMDEGRMLGHPVILDATAWTIDEIPGPNVTDKETMLSFARMAADAYVPDDGEGEWLDVGGGFNYTEDFGWENDGLRGHVFADAENSTVVVSIKGTSAAMFDGSGTTTNDKINDNLFFSCCCGQGGQYRWLQVCDCQSSAYKCNSTCVVQALQKKNRYYYAAQEIYRNVSDIYPEANIWLTGHSLGGATSSLVALTYGLPVVTFEAPGEAMPASRLGLPTPPGYHLGESHEPPHTGGFHFGHTADPIYMGTCNTFTSTCTIAGYAMQSVCHTGMMCTYDTVGDLGWRNGIGNHPIQTVIKTVLEKYEEPAKCELVQDCTDCFNWEYFRSNHSDPISTTSSTSTKSTSTTTCKTPGWWGCLDETTTTTTTATSTTTSTTTSTSTTTCETPGWFGCKDPTTSTNPKDPPTTTTDEQTQTIPESSTTTCHTPGWFGCKDPTSTKGQEVTATITTPPESEPPSTTTTRRPLPTCIRRTWYGACKEWSGASESWKADL